MAVRQLGTEFWVFLGQTGHDKFLKFLPRSLIFVTHFKSSYWGHTCHRLGDCTCSVLLVVRDEGDRVGRAEFPVHTSSRAVMSGAVFSDGDLLFEEISPSLWIGGPAIHHDGKSWLPSPLRENSFQNLPPSWPRSPRCLLENARAISASVLVHTADPWSSVFML